MNSSRSMIVSLSTLKPALIIVGILYLQLLFQGFFLNNLFPIHIGQQNLLQTSLIGVNLNIPFWIIFISNIINNLLIWLIIRKTIFPQIANLTSLIYAVCPWTSYLSIGGSDYIMFLTFLLTGLLGFVYLREKHIKLGSLLLVTSAVAMVWSEILLWPLVLVFLGYIYKEKLLPKKLLSKLVYIIIILCLPVLGMMIHNKKAVTNVLHQEIGYLSDVGIFNTVNHNRGENTQAKSSKITTLIENRYTYLTLNFLQNIIESFDPMAYFSPTNSLVDRTFTAPIYFGLLIPLLFGIRQMIKKALWKRVYYLFIFGAVLPAILSFKIPDLNRLVLISPLIFLIIASGLFYLSKIRILMLKNCLILTVSIILAIQLTVMLVDVSIREPLRLEKERLSVPVNVNK